MLERTTSLEQRAVSFKIQEEYKEQFVKELKINEVGVGLEISID